MVGLGGRALKKGEGVTVWAEVFDETSSLREAGSSSRPMSLCMEPMS